MKILRHNSNGEQETNMYNIKEVVCVI